MCPLTAASRAHRSDLRTAFVRTARRTKLSSCAGELSGGGGTVDLHANCDAFGVFVLTGFRFTAVGRVKEETSTPHTRLAYIHLQSLLTYTYRPMIAKVTVLILYVNEIQRV